MKVGEDSERDSDYLEISPLVNYLKASSCQKDGFHKEDEEHSLEYECLHCKHAQGISTQASFMVVGVVGEDRKDILGYEFFKSPSIQTGLQAHPLPKTSLTLMEYSLPKDIY